MKKMIIVVMTLIMMFTMASCGKSEGGRTVTTSYHVTEAYEVSGVIWVPYTKTVMVDGEVVEIIEGATNNVSSIPGMG